MSFDDLLKDMDVAVFDAFGEEAIHNGRALCHVVIDRNVERINGYGEVLAKHTELSINKVGLSSVSKGDTFRVSGAVFTVDSVVSDDGSIIIVSVT